MTAPSLAIHIWGYRNPRATETFVAYLAFKLVSNKHQKKHTGVTGIFFIENGAAPMVAESQQAH